MQERFYKCPYDVTFIAHVTETRGTPKGLEVCLDDTIFYPEGGGQPSDRGKLGTVNVLFVHKEKNKIWHLVDAELNVGDEVKCELDWSWRFGNMQNHTAEHMVSGLVHKAFKLDNVGFHMDGKEVTVDFNGILDEEQIKGIEKQSNEAVWKNLPVCVDFPDEQTLKQLDYRSKIELSGEVRIIRIPEVDMCACCGTHVKSTAEIGLIKILGFTKHRGGTRVRMTAGIRAIEDYEQKLQHCGKISELLSAKPDEIVPAVEQQLKAAESLSFELNKKTDQWLELMAKDQPDQEKLVVFVDNLNPSQLKKLCLVLSETKQKATFIAILSKTVQKGVDGFNYVLFCKNGNIRQISIELNKKLNGRGGGRDGFAQGSFLTTAEAIKNILAESKY